MSCTEAHCTNWLCDWSMFANTEPPPECPKCGAKTASYWDEEYDHHDDD